MRVYLQLYRRRIVAGLALLAAIVGLALSARGASALPSNEVITTYYSDASRTTEVGERHLFCTGQTVRWGTTTKYATQVSFPCN